MLHHPQNAVTSEKIAIKSLSLNVLKKLKAGYTQKQTADFFGISPSSVCRIYRKYIQDSDICLNLTYHNHQN